MNEQPEDFLCFLLEGQRFRVPLGQVREVVKVPLLTEVPRAAPEVLGLMSLRGALVPVYDVRARLGLGGSPPDLSSPEAPPPSREARVVVAVEPLGEVGLYVEAVEGVVRAGRPAAGQRAQEAGGRGRLLDLAELLA